MNDERIAAEREAIARRVAEFRDTQERFQRAREDHYEETIEKIRDVHWNNPVKRSLSN